MPNFNPSDTIEIGQKTEQNPPKREKKDNIKHTYRIAQHFKLNRTIKIKFSVKFGIICIKNI